MALSIFSETVLKAISEYRKLLRRYLSQADRVNKLMQLRLKDVSINRDDYSLYQVARNIVRDIEENLSIEQKSYYSYSGVMQFATYLKEFLNGYIVEGRQVIHRARKASNAIIQAIQLLAQSEHKLTDTVAEKIFKCHDLIVTYGDSEQFEMYRENLCNQQSRHPLFFARVMKDFDDRLRKDEAA